ncbi:hypothetical protein ACFSSF_19565 [Dietzia aerolata]|uniref:hypothetical protein n=1 Tax=Dietzia aerolata TaxID=595984 RepID=UPI0036332A18
MTHLLDGHEPVTRPRRADHLLGASDLTLSPTRTSTAPVRGDTASISSTGPPRWTAITTATYS